MGHRREYDIILLVGLTELKAQVSWIDSRTVGVYLDPRVFFILPCLCVRGSRGKRKGLQRHFPFVRSQTERIS